MADKQNVEAVCIVELVISCGSVWSDDTTMAQIVKQAKDECEGRLRKLFDDAGDQETHASRREGSRGISFRGIKKIVTQAVTTKE